MIKVMIIVQLYVKICHICSISATEPKRRRLWGLRGLVKMFRRRVRRQASASTSPEPGPTTLRARSTSELQVDQSMRTSVGPYNQGLSVSHDSVFSPDTPSGVQAHTPPALVIATRGVNMVSNTTKTINFKDNSILNK